MPKEAVRKSLDLQVGSVLRTVSGNGNGNGVVTDVFTSAGKNPLYVVLTDFGNQIKSMSTQELETQFLPTGIVVDIKMRLKTQIKLLTEQLETLDDQ